MVFIVFIICSFWMLFLIKSIYMVLYVFIVNGVFIPLCKIRM